MSETTYMKQIWIKTDKNKMADSNFKSEEKETARFKDEEIDLKTDDLVYPTRGKNSVNSSVLTGNHKRNIYVLIRKAYRRKPSRNIAAAYILQGLKTLFMAYHIEFYHLDTKHDLIVFQEDSYEAASRNCIMDLAKIFNSIENKTQVKCKFQFMIFQQSVDKHFTDIIEDAKKFMISVCHNNIPGAVVIFTCKTKDNTPA